MKKGLCLIFLFNFLSSCAFLKKNKITEVILSSENLLENETEGNTSTFTYMRKTAPLDSVLIQITFSETSPNAFDCHMIKGKSPYKCEPVMHHKWKAKLAKNPKTNWTEMTAEGFFICDNIKYRLLASYSGTTSISPGIEPH